MFILHDVLKWININHALFMDVIISFYGHIRGYLSVSLPDSLWLWMLNKFSKTSKTPSSKKLSLTIFVQKKTPLQKYLLSNYYPVLFSIKLRMKDIYYQLLHIEHKTQFQKQHNFMFRKSCMLKKQRRMFHFFHILIYCKFNNIMQLT